MTLGFIAIVLKTNKLMKPQVEPGTTVAPEKYRIVIADGGPYLVYGQPPMVQQFIMPNGEGEIWYFKEGAHYSTKDEPTALCRCGYSKNKPYCDGSHEHADWDPALTASIRPLLEDAEQIDGPEITLTDNEKYCAFARFCDAKGRVWNLAEEEGQEAAELTIREANHCPAGRLSAWKDDKAPVEPHFDPGLGLLEDPLLRISSALWVRGGIPVQRPDGFTYEIRNRVTLCRCGHSSNKPFCDGTHASFKFRDGLPNRPDPNGEEY